MNNRTVPMCRTRFTLLIRCVLSYSVRLYCLLTINVLNTFPEVVHVCVSAPVVGVFNIAVMFVQ